jgi:hypothetical protein
LREFFINIFGIVSDWKRRRIRRIAWGGMQAGIEMEVDKQVILARETFEHQNQTEPRGHSRIARLKFRQKHWMKRRETSGVV